jgi:hypothetical protein
LRIFGSAPEVLRFRVAAPLFSSLRRKASDLIYQGQTDWTSFLGLSSIVSLATVAKARQSYSAVKVLAGRKPTLP